MHRIHRSHCDAITNAKTPAELRPAIQSAIQLEHATIPAYLCGYFTLKPGSNKAVADIVLGVAIEEPNRPLVIPSAATPDGVVIEAPGAETIGDFYNHIAAKIKTFGDAAFTGDFSKVVVSLKWFPDENDMFRITDTASALRAIDVIVDQGEGSSVDPFDHDGYPAHFYRFPIRYFFQI